jgi:hypothetical protein
VVLPKVIGTAAAIAAPASAFSLATLASSALCPQDEPMFHRGKLSDDALASRIARTREAGYARGASEARLMLLAVGRKIERRRALDWLNSAVQNGRIELQKQCAVDREIEAWDMSCRIMFMVSCQHRVAGP